MVQILRIIFRNGFERHRPEGCHLPYDPIARTASHARTVTSFQFPYRIGVARDVFRIAHVCHRSCHQWSPTRTDSMDGTAPSGMTLLLESTRARPTPLRGRFVKALITRRSLVQIQPPPPSEHRRPRSVPWAFVV